MIGALILSLKFPSCGPFFSLPTTVHVNIDLIPPLDESPCTEVQYNSFLQKWYPKRQDTRVI